MSHPKPLGDRPTVLVDGACGFCRRGASWVRRQPGGESLDFVAYQKVQAPWMDEAMREACHEAMHVVLMDGRVLKGGEAACFVFERIGWGPIAKLLQLGPMAWATELGYRQVAAQRLILSGFLFKDHPDDEDLKAPEAQLGLACGVRAPQSPTPPSAAA